MSKRFSLSQARDLIKRELGISVAALAAPDDMNRNHKPEKHFER